MSLLPFFEWMEALQLSVVFRESVWFTAAIQAVHLVALTVFMGSVLVVDLRLLGRGLTQQTVSQVAKDAQPWFILGLVALIVTGIPQMTSTAIKQYYSPFFWLKMEFLLVAIIFTFTLHNKITRTEELKLGFLWPKIAGIVSMALWAGIAIQARLIGLL